jgi:hypothetical protein
MEHGLFDDLPDLNITLYNIDGFPYVFWIPRGYVCLLFSMTETMRI